MFKKFLAFLGLASITLKDGKATVEMTEEQMEASGKIIDECDKAVAEVARLTSELDAANVKIAEAEQKLADATARLSTATNDIASLKGELETLAAQPAAETAALVTGSNAVKKEGSVCVSSESNDFFANVLAVQEAYL